MLEVERTATYCLFCPAFFLFFCINLQPKKKNSQSIYKFNPQKFIATNVSGRSLQNQMCRPDLTQTFGVWTLWFPSVDFSRSILRWWV